MEPHYEDLSGAESCNAHIMKNIHSLSKHQTLYFPQVKQHNIIIITKRIKVSVIVSVFLSSSQNRAFIAFLISIYPSIIICRNKEISSGNHNTVGHFNISNNACKIVRQC